MILHTERFGSGEPVLFLHSGLQTGETDFEYQRKYFTESYRVITADLRGHGKSNTEDFSNYLEDSARDVIETITDLNLDSVHIIGSSLGALVGLLVAKKHPQYVKSLTISGIVPEKPANWADLLAGDIEKQSALLEDERVVAYFDDLHESDWKKIIGMSQGGDWYPFEETKDLSILSMPVLYIVGEEHDHERKGALIYPQMNDNIHVSIIPFSGHNVHLEQPRIYTEIVAEFLERVMK